MPRVAKAKGPAKAEKKQRKRKLPEGESEDESSEFQEKEEEEQIESEEYEPKSSKKKAKPMKAKPKATKKIGRASLYEQEEEEEKEEADQDYNPDPTFNKENAKVDGMVPDKDKFQVYQENGVVYTASLMWSDVKHNNNKFYMVQLLQETNNPNSFIVWNRWGRVGSTGQFAQFRYSESSAAIRQYLKKYKDKVGKGYTEIEINYEDEEEKKEKDEIQEEFPRVELSSSLDPRVQELVNLIFNMKMMQKQMADIGYDAKKMPLGKLSKTTITKGYEILRKISDVLEGKAKGDVADLSSEFFTVIPHDFGFAKMSQFIINSNDKLKAKLEMIQSLGDIEIAARLIETKGKTGVAEVESNYEKLNCNITPIETYTEDYRVVSKYIENTQKNTEYKLEILDLFKIRREEEDERFRRDVGNPMLLWHGSRLSNFVGILSQGLRIAPPEAPVSGYMFGKGIYFADVVCKSADYCHANNSDNIGLLLLCKVAIGNPRKLTNGDFNASDLPLGYHSTKGLGEKAPDPSYNTLYDYSLVPIGEPISTGEFNCALLYNEYIIYDVCQAQIEYLVKVKFKYDQVGSFLCN